MTDTHNAERAEAADARQGTAQPCPHCGGRGYVDPPRIVKLARLILANARDGVCSRALLREVYADRDPAAAATGSQKPTAWLADPGDRNMRQRGANRGQNLRAAARGMRWTAPPAGKKGGSDGRRSSGVLGKDLARLARYGLVERAEDTVRVIDAEGLLRVARGQLPEGEG